MVYLLACQIITSIITYEEIRRKGMDLKENPLEQIQDTNEVVEVFLFVNVV